MALITCPECGKEFSDRASACPNCGCPTNEILASSIEEPAEPIDNTSDDAKTIDTNPAQKVFGFVQNSIESAIENSQNAFKATKKIGPVQVDENHQVFRISGHVVPNKKGGVGQAMAKGTFAMATMGLSLLVPSGKKVGSKEWYPFSDLVSYDLLEDDSLVTSGGVGQALIGGAIFGGFGAIAGGVTAKRNTKKKVNSLIIKVTLNDFDTPCLMLPLITKPVKTDSKEYKKAFNDAHQILSLLDVITHNK